ncbi:adenine deaminase [Peteryoungia desertarenae]|uniref:Adenine deaminase n=1 Tax=Peteryoungia desertarenae TaxID=1813451 RepID=A0ABX6QI73_9HYPH|nr:adenine deaminase [Peteryoungia desertarenae]QLF68264.1 adenine deaminase [Peteryoungia desertarenae]
MSSLESRIDQGVGREPADIVLKGGRFFDLTTGELVASDIAICGDTIVGTCGEYDGREVIDISGRIVVPGFIDTHLHIESSVLTPQEFDRCVLPYGVTTIICDPHEIANVLGTDGIQFFLDSAMESVMDIRVQLSSCVPATHLETAGADLPIEKLLPFRDHPKVVGLAEFMNFPGVIHKDPGCLAKLEAFQGGHIDGHAPLLLGKELNGYLSTGIRTDHECTSAAEALEKIRKGVHVLVREGSVCKDLHHLLPVITERLSPFIALCTDDRNPLDIADEGHLDHSIRTAIAHGVEPIAVYRAASISAARAFGLRDRGLIAPGWRADLVVIDSLENCAADMVFAGGRKVTEALFASRKKVEPVGLDSVRITPRQPKDFAIAASDREFPVIGVVPGQVITEHRRLRLPMAGNEATMDFDRDIIKVAVIERHGKNGNHANGFVQGFGLKKGAIASTVGHDSHNICVVGANESDMAIAVNRLAEIKGGFVVVADGEVLGEISLPVAGLMSLQSFETVRDELKALRQKAVTLGTSLQEPFLQVSFLPLPVIPHLKLTDMGMVDVDRFELIA